MTELLKEIRKKDKQAVQVLYTRYGKKLYAYAVYKWKLNEDESWELIYKTLYKILEVIERYTFEDEKKFAGFIFQSFVNNLRNHYQEKKRKEPETVEFIDNYKPWEGNKNEGPQEEEVAKPVSAHMRLLEEEMAKLEEWKRILLLMRAQDYPYEQIAKFISKPESQLKVYYLRLKKQLTEKINERLNEEKK